MVCSTSASRESCSRIAPASGRDRGSRLLNHSVVNRLMVSASLTARSVKAPSSTLADSTSCGALGAIKSPTLTMGGKCGSLAGKSMLETLEAIFYVPCFNPLFQEAITPATHTVHSITHGPRLHLAFELSWNQWKLAFTVGTVARRDLIRVAGRV